MLWFCFPSDYLQILRGLSAASGQITCVWPSNYPWLPARINHGIPGKRLKFSLLRIVQLFKHSHRYWNTSAVCIIAHALHTHRLCHTSKTSHKRSVNQSRDSPWCIVCQGASMVHMALWGIQNLKESIAHHEVRRTAHCVCSELAAEPLFLIHLATDDDLVADKNLKNIITTWLKYQVLVQLTCSCFPFVYVSYGDTQE